MLYYIYISFIIEQTKIQKKRKPIFSHTDYKWDVICCSFSLCWKRTENKSLYKNKQTKGKESCWNQITKQSQLFLYNQFHLPQCIQLTLFIESHRSSLVLRLDSISDKSSLCPNLIVDDVTVDTTMPSVNLCIVWLRFLQLIENRIEIKFRKN